MQKSQSGVWCSKLVRNGFHMHIIHKNVLKTFVGVEIYIFCLRVGSGEPLPPPIRQIPSRSNCENFPKKSVFRGLLGRYASVTDHIAPGWSPHVCYEPAKDEDHRPSGDRVGPIRNPGLQPTSPLRSTTQRIHQVGPQIQCLLYHLGGK